MSVQRLNAKWMSRIELSTGLTVKRAWGHGGYVHEFVTDDHKHMWFDVHAYRKGVGRIFGPIEEDRHYATCFTEMFVE